MCSLSMEVAMVEPALVADKLVGELRNVFWTINCTAPLSASASVRVASSGVLPHVSAVEEEQE